MVSPGKLPATSPSIHHPAEDVIIFQRLDAKPSRIQLPYSNVPRRASFTLRIPLAVAITRSIDVGFTSVNTPTPIMTWHIPLGIMP